MDPLCENFRARCRARFVAVAAVCLSALGHAADARARWRRRRTASAEHVNYATSCTSPAKVLRDNPRVRRALQHKYRRLFVDEFQDTDPVQAEIVFLLAARARRREPGPPTGARPLRPGSLFVVGDPKQSIYRFRRADIEIYNIVRERFGDTAFGRVLPLTMNFRSVPALASGRIRVFSKRFPRPPTRRAPRFFALDSNDRGPQPRAVSSRSPIPVEKDETLDLDAGRIAPTSAPRWMPAGGSSATS